jgi:hypothetical protein
VRGRGLAGGRGLQQAVLVLQVVVVGPLVGPAVVLVFLHHLQHVLAALVVHLAGVHWLDLPLRPRVLAVSIQASHCVVVVRVFSLVDGQPPDSCRTSPLGAPPQRALSHVSSEGLGIALHAIVICTAYFYDRGTLLNLFHRSFFSWLMVWVK